MENLLIKADNSFLPWKSMLVRLTMTYETACMQLCLSTIFSLTGLFTLQIDFI